MEENIIEGVAEEKAPEEIASSSDPVDNSVDEVVDQEEIVAPRPRKSQESNMRDLRLAKERAERERAQLADRIAEYEKQKEAASAPVYGDEDFVEGKHLKREVEAIRKQLKNYESQATQLADEARLKSKYSDFYKVVTSEAIDRLKDDDPEFAETIAMSQSSLYARGSSTYKRIKELGIYIEDTHSREKEIALKNAAKPKSVNSVSPQRGESPLTMANAFANGLTDDLKKQLWEEMQESSKRH